MPHPLGNIAVALATLAVERGWLDRPALIAAGHARTYAEMFATTRKYAAGLHAAGARRGDHVLVLLPDGFDCVTTLLGALMLGAVAVVGNPRLPSVELLAQIARTTPVAVVCEKNTAAVLRNVRTLAPEQLADSGCCEPPTEILSGGEPGYGLFTSGTTGDPKLCVHSHNHPLIHNQAFGVPVLGLSPGDTVHSIPKLNFAYGLGNSIWYPLLNGATAVLEPEHPTAERVLDTISVHQVNILFAVPSFYAKLLAHPNKSALTQLRIAVSAGEMLPPTVERQLMALDGPTVLNSIGSTETGQAFASNSLRAHRFGTVGRALPPYRIRVVDRDENPVPAGVEGSLEVAGPTVVRPRSSTHIPEPAHTNLWHRTGDAAIVDADGYLKVVGRVDDIEIVSGINVHPTEIEQALLESSWISDVAVCSLTDESGVSRLVAFIIPATPQTDPGQLTARIHRDLRSRIAGFKVPRTTVLVTTLPRTATGKLRRNALRSAARHWQNTGTWQLEDHENLGK